MFSKNYKPAPAWLEISNKISDPVEPADFPQSTLRYRNRHWSDRLGMGELTDAQWIEHFAQFKPLPENLPQPLALRYHGHQFTHYNPDLGDGRGFLFAQMMDPQTQRLLDLGTKGSGQTPYSRQGDGRLTLKGAVREALATAYLEYQGVNTSKTFSVIETGEKLVRHDEPSPTRSAVLVRLSHSHIRIGTFQRLAFHKDHESMRSLIDYCLQHHFQDIKDPSGFFAEVCRRTARTTAQWMIHGFVHGVLNTDNINITGESFDYGPYRLLPYYDTKFTAAYFDHQSLYAYGQQPTMVFWNLERLQEALSELDFPQQSFDEGFEVFKKEFNQFTLQLFCKKIGIATDNPLPEQQNLFYQCLQFLEKTQAPYEAFFHNLYCWHQDLTKPLNLYFDKKYQVTLLEEIEIQLGKMQRDPDAIEKTEADLETLLIDEIEAVWNDIDKNDDWTAFNSKIKRLESKVALSNFQ